MVANTKGKVTLEMMVKSSQADASLKKLDASLRRVIQSANRANNVAFGQGRAQTLINQVTAQGNRERVKAVQTMEKYNAQMKKATSDKLQNTLRNTQNLLLGMGLSMLFTGMAIKNTIEGFIRKAVDGYLQIADKNSAMLKDVLKMQAAFKFLQFAIVEALSAAGFFDWVAELFQNIARWINKLTPEQKAFWADFAKNGIIVGGVMMILGQTFLALLAPLAIIKFLAGGVSLNFALWAAAILVLVAAFLIFRSDLTLSQKIIAGIIAAMSTGLAVLRLFGITVTLLGALWAVALLGVLVVLGLLIKKFGSFKDAMIAWGQAIALAILFAVGFVLDGILELIKWAVLGLYKLIQLANKIPGVNIDTSGIDPWIDKLMNYSFSRDFTETASKAMLPYAPKEVKEEDQQGLIDGIVGGFKESMKDVFNELGSDFFKNSESSFGNPTSQ